MQQLKILTLNVWGVPVPIFGSPDRKERMEAIGVKLAQSDWDIVALQELWDFKDYESIRDKVANVLPGAFYFHSGLVGSGVCIFTKGEITVTIIHRYSLNGYPHHVHRGDWFGGKIVGLARVNFPDLNDLKVDVYATHLHAEYDRNNDLYIPHRVLQAFELSQFVKETTCGDVAFVVGDLNFEPGDMGFQLVTSNAQLLDAYTTRRDQTQPWDADPNGLTCDAQSNSYTTQKQPHWPSGKRIDYVLYRGNANSTIECQTCFTTMGRIPQLEINYSDHEAVCATFNVKPGGVRPVSLPVPLPLLDQAIDQMESGIESAKTTQLWNKIYTGLGVASLLITIPIEFYFETRLCTALMLMTRFGLTPLIGFWFLNGFVGMKMEEKALMAARDGMRTLRRQQARLQGKP